MVDRDKLIDALIKNARKAEEKKKAEEKAKRDAEKAKKRRHEVMLRRSLRAKEHRKIVMAQSHLKQLRRKSKKRIAKLRRRRINHRYYIRHRRRPYVRRRLHKGDEIGRFVLCFVANKKQEKYLGRFNWKMNALGRFDKMIEENHANTVCPAIYDKDPKYGGIPVVRELIVRKRIDPNKEANETTFRDEYGASVLVKTSNPEWKILAKDIWYTEETFYVYGYHPKFDRKNAKWMIDHIIMENAKKGGFCRIFVWKCYMFMEWDDDFTFAVAYNPSECERLYNILFDRLYNEEGVYFTGEIQKRHVNDWVIKMLDKTGWTEETIKRCNPIIRTEPRLYKKKYRKYRQ